MARDIIVAMRTVIVTPTLTTEVLGWIAQRKETFQRNLKLVPNYVILITVQLKLSKMMTPMKM